MTSCYQNQSRSAFQFHRAGNDIRGGNERCHARRSVIRLFSLCPTAQTLNGVEMIVLHSKSYPFGPGDKAWPMRLHNLAEVALYCTRQTQLIGFAPMEMQQVRYFLALARELNFTRAAESCNVTQPALTRAIKALEEELGGPLFHRERARTHLSELGRMMMPHIEAIKEQSDAVKQQAQSYSKVQGLELKLGAMCTIGPTILSDLIVQFHSDFGSVILAIYDSEGNAIVDALINGKLEVGILGLPGPPDERLHAIPLFKERFVVVLPPGHRLAERNVLSVKDLAGEPYLNRVNCEVFASARKVFQEQGVDSPMVFRSGRDDWVLGMIRAGMGWGFFPEFCAIPDNLPVRPLIDPPFDRTISLMTMRGRPHSPAVGAFVRAISGHKWPTGDT